MKSLFNMLLLVCFALACLSAQAQYTSPDGALEVDSTKGWEALPESGQGVEYGFLNTSKTTVIRICIYEMNDAPEVVEAFVLTEEFRQRMVDQFSDSSYENLKTGTKTMFGREAFVITTVLPADDEPILEGTGNNQYGVAYTVAIGNRLVLLGIISNDPDPQDKLAVKAFLLGLTVYGVPYAK